MTVIILRSVASISSGATMYLLASSAVSGGRPELGAVAAAVEAAAGAPVCACERVCLVVA
eukprot:3281595-Pleurochrysis_carterae.AAC.1